MKVNLGPVTRLDGHLSIETRVENHKITNARANVEMYRGFETILQGLL